MNTPESPRYRVWPAAVADTPGPSSAPYACMVTARTPGEAARAACEVMWDKWGPECAAGKTGGWAGSLGVRVALVMDDGAYGDTTAWLVTAEMVARFGVELVKGGVAG